MNEFGSKINGRHMISPDFKLVKKFNLLAPKMKPKPAGSIENSLEVEKYEDEETKKMREFENASTMLKSTNLSAVNSLFIDNSTIMNNSMIDKTRSLNRTFINYGSLREG